jgi:hypothetical protein
MKKGRVSSGGRWFVVRVLSGSGGVERCSCLYGLLGGRIRRNWIVARGRKSLGVGLCRQTNSGASGSELLVAGKHVPDRVGEPAGDVDLGDLGAALAAEPALGALVALGVGGVAQGVHGGFEHRPAQVLGALLGQRAAAIALTGLVHARAQAGVATQLLRRRKARDVADLGGDRERQHPADPGNGQQQCDVWVVGAVGA